MKKWQQRPIVIHFTAIADCAAYTASAENDKSVVGFGDACTAEGNGPGSDNYKSCVADKIASHCASAGSAATPEYKACVKDENSRAFIRDMIGRQGY